MAKLNTAAAITWSAGTGTERVLLLDVPLRDLRPGFTRTVFTAESLDKSDIQSITVGNGANELVGTVRYEDDPQGLMDMVAAGAANTTLTYIPQLSDPDVNYSVKLISPRDLSALNLQLDPQRSTFGEMSIELRFRQTDETAFTEAYDGNGTLFSYKAGGSLADATFSRADTATYVSKGYGTLTSAASGAARIHWMDTDADGIRETPTLLLEGASTNLIVESSDFGTTWTNSGTVLTSGQSDPMGTSTAYLVEDNSAAAAESISITPTFTTDAVSKAISVFVKAGTATTSVVNLQDVTAGASRLTVSLAWSNGVPTATASVGTHLSTVRHINGWYRILCRTTAVTVANTNTVFLYPAGTTVGDTGTCNFFGVQAENALNPTSYIPTDGGTDARTRDKCTFPLVAKVQSCTAYVRLVQQGTLPLSGAAAGLYLCLGGVSTAETRFEVRNSAGASTIIGQIGGLASNSSGAITPGASHGQVVEYVLWIRYTASTQTATAQIQAAVAGTIGTASTVSAATRVSDGFANDIIEINGATTATVEAFGAYTHVHVQRGIRDMLEMRRLAGV